MLHIDLSPRTKRYVDHLPLALQRRIYQGIHAYAERREGTLRWEPPYQRLALGAYEAEVVIHEEDSILSVTSLYRARK
jgi:hypothetical protein